MAGHFFAELRIPTFDVGILGEIDLRCHLHRGDRSQNAEIRHGQLIPGNVRGLSEVDFQKFEGLFQFLELFFVELLVFEYGWVVVFGETSIQRAHVEVQPLIDNGSLLRVTRVELIVFAVFLDQIDQYGTRLPQDEIVVHQRWDDVLRVYL